MCFIAIMVMQTRELQTFAKTPVKRESECEDICQDPNGERMQITIH